MSYTPPFSSPHFLCLILQVAAGNQLFHLIVDNDSTAAHIMQKLEKGNLGRVTFMPLNKVENFSLILVLAFAFDLGLSLFHLVMCLVALFALRNTTTPLPTCRVHSCVSKVSRTQIQRTFGHCSIPQYNATLRLVTCLNG